MQLSADADYTPQRMAVSEWNVPGRLPAPRVSMRVLGSQVLLDWDPVPGAQGYLVYRLPQPYQPEGRVLVGECTDPSFTLPLTTAQGFYQVSALR
jgi:hypothetical protein